MVRTDVTPGFPTLEHPGMEFRLCNDMCMFYSFSELVAFLASTVMSLEAKAKIPLLWAFYKACHSLAQPGTVWDYIAAE